MEVGERALKNLHLNLCDYNSDSDSDLEEDEKEDEEKENEKDDEESIDSRVIEWDWNTPTLPEVIICVYLMFI